MLLTEISRRRSSQPAGGDRRLGSFLEGRWLVVSFIDTFLPEKPFLPLSTPAHAYRQFKEGDPSYSSALWHRDHRCMMRMHVGLYIRRMFTSRCCDQRDHHRSAFGLFHTEAAFPQLKPNTDTFPALWFQQSCQHTCHIQQGDRTGLSLSQTRDRLTEQL